MHLTHSVFAILFFGAIYLSNNNRNFVCSDAAHLTLPADKRSYNVTLIQAAAGGRLFVLEDECKYRLGSNDDLKLIGLDGKNKVKIMDSAYVWGLPVGTDNYLERLNCCPEWSISDRNIVGIDVTDPEFYRPYYLVEATCGLAVRMATIAGFLYAASANGVYHIVMVWRNNLECNGHFLDIMEPIPNVTFIPIGKRRRFELNATKSFRNHYPPFRNILIMNGLRVTNDSELEKIQRESYRIFVPNPYVRDQVERYVRKNAVCDSVSVHIRRTDKVNMNDRAAIQRLDQRFYEIIESFPSNQSIFLMTDNPTTQDQYIEKYRGSKNSPKILVYGNLTEVSQSLPLLRQRLRYADLRYSFIELLIAAHSRSFYGSHEISSFSGLVDIFRRLFAEDKDSICKRKE